MKDNNFSFCPNCGSKNIKTVNAGHKWLCPDCEFDLYNNVASAVGLLIQNEKGEILLEKRAKDPRKGFLAFPGGFTDADETAEEACIRECKEETGVAPLSVEYLCSYPNTYIYKDIIYKTCDMFFTAALPPHYTLKRQEGEVDSFVWKKITGKEDIEACPLAFDSAKKTLLNWLKKNEH